MKRPKPIFFALDQKLVRRHKIFTGLALGIQAVVLIAVLGISLLSGSNQKALAASYTWDGGGLTNNWSDCDNWSTNVCPLAADTVTFSGTSSKNSTVDVGFGGEVGGITISTASGGYSGIITLARDLRTGPYSQTAGTFNAGSFALDFTTTISITGGTFTAPSTTMDSPSTFTIGASATFNHNNGTVIINGGSGTITCGNAVFNRVEFQNTSTKAVQAGCSLPLGNDPDISTIGSITLNGGTLSGSGTLTLSAASGNVLTLNSGASLSGFSGFSGRQLAINTTADFSSYSSFLLRSTLNVNSGGHLIAPASSTIFNGVANINAGSAFTASSADMTFRSTVTIDPAATFNANSGIVIFSNTSSTISCGNATFNLVEFQNTTTKTVSADCNLPLGTDPVIEGSISLSGTLNGSGTITANGSVFTLNAGAVLSGFNGLVSAGTFTNAGADIDLSAYDPVDLAGFVLSSGTFTAPAGGMSVSNTFTISGGTFNHNNGTLVFDGGGITSCSNATFNLVIIDGGNNIRTIDNDCTLPLGTDPVVSRITLSGTLTGSGTLSIFSDNSNRFLAGADLIGFDSLIADAVIIDGATLDLGSYTSAEFRLNSSVASGALIAPSSTLSIAQDFSVLGGTFDPNGGTVILNGTDQTLAGDITFHNLTKTVTAPVTLTLIAGSTQTIEGDLTLEGGDENNLLSLVSSTPGSQWNIDAQGARTLQYLSVQDSNNINSNAMLAYDSQDLGNNVNWQFLLSPLPVNPGADPNGQLAGTGERSFEYIVFSILLTMISATVVLTLKWSRE